LSSFKRRIGISLVSFGFDPRRTLSSVRFVAGYVADLLAWVRKTNAAQRAQFPLRLLPTLSDKYAESGIASGHYFHQDLWAARHIHRHAPLRHVDVGSRIDGFVAHLLSFREVEVLDIRVLVSKVVGLSFRQANLMSNAPLTVEQSMSVSCLHALEHFGLGRYGDPLDVDGWRKGLRNLAGIVSPGGLLYIGVPISNQQRIEFNAQRIFAPETIVEAARDLGLTMIEFSYIDDEGNFIENSEPKAVRCEFGCGCYVFAKSEIASI
jgi:Caenorhabditis protein of unknown function, DUF268